MNNLRKQAAYSLDKVIKTLNSGIMQESTFASEKMPDGKMKHFSGNVLVEKERLQKNIDHLRSCVWALLCCYDENDPMFKCVYEDVEQSGGLSIFNPEESSINP